MFLGPHSAVCTGPPRCEPLSSRNLGRPRHRVQWVLCFTYPLWVNFLLYLGGRGAALCLFCLWLCESLSFLTQWGPPAPFFYCYLLLYFLIFKMYFSPSLKISEIEMGLTVVMVMFHSHSFPLNGGWVRGMSNVVSWAVNLKLCLQPLRLQGKKVDRGEQQECPRQNSEGLGLNIQDRWRPVRWDLPSHLWPDGNCLRIRELSPHLSLGFCVALF